VIDHELFTKEKRYHLPRQGVFRADLAEDILKIAVLNRYEEGKRPALGFVNGFGLKQGAIASSVALDSHNVIAVGCDDASMAKVMNAIIASKGGVAATDGERVVHLPLEVAGIMSSGDAFEVAEAYEMVDCFAREVLGSPLSAPFMTLSFMALLVIPELKLSDKGLFDGRTFHFMPVCHEKMTI
jgi:adenine deaminase